MAETYQAIDIKSLERPILAIVRMKCESEMRIRQGALFPYYRVTIDRDNLSPSGDFIYLGSVAGDEFFGFRPTTDIVIEEVIGEYASAPPKQVAHQTGKQVELLPFVAAHKEAA